VITDLSPSNPSGYVGADTRVARHNARLWSGLGTPIDRNAGIPVRQPSAENGPRIGIDIQGQTAVAWRQQPGQASKLTAPRLMVNGIPDVFAESAKAFAGGSLSTWYPFFAQPTGIDKVVLCTQRVGVSSRGATGGAHRPKQARGGGVLRGICGLVGPQADG